MRRAFVTWWMCVALFLVGAAAAQGWTTVSPEGGRYRVDMPGTPKVNVVPISSAGQTASMTEAAVQVPGANYLVSWIDYPDRIAQAHAADVLLDRARDGMAAGHTLRGEKKITLGRAAGREFVVAEANGNINAVRIYFARNRLYTLTVTGRAGIENQPDTRRFFDSFGLVRPQAS
jgi:hypothetical protein